VGSLTFLSNSNFSKKSGSIIYSTKLCYFYSLLAVLATSIQYSKIGRNLFVFPYVKIILNIGSLGREPDLSILTLPLIVGILFCSS